MASFAFTLPSGEVRDITAATEEDADLVAREVLENEGEDIGWLDVCLDAINPLCGDCGREDAFPVNDDETQFRCARCAA